MKTILVDALGTLVDKEHGLVAEVHSLLESFPNRKIIVTNANAEERAALLPNMPYEVFSLDHNPEKTDPTYYRTLLATYNLEPQQVIYFEHNPEAAESARSVGITTHRYEATPEGLRRLSRFLGDHAR